MSAYTPGPWQVVNGTDIFTRLGGRNASGVEAARNDGWHIADCDMGPSSTEEGEADISHAEKMANARLIAAAPELLEALVALFNDYKRLADSGDAGFWRLEDVPEGKQALAAIAKATGEQS